MRGYPQGTWLNTAEPGADPGSANGTPTLVARAARDQTPLRTRPVQRRPPRSWCARKKFSDPAVAIADEAEISSASAVAATSCAKR